MEWFVKWEFYFLRMRSGVLKYDEIFFTSVSQEIKISSYFS